jgi:hypothetical protein
MRALIVYESIFGSTRHVAEAIGKGIGAEGDGVVVAVGAAPDVLDGFDLVVVGGPTQAWSMSWPSTRRSAPVRVAKPESDLVLEPGADTGPGVREWLKTVRDSHVKAAAFDTRINSRVLFTGRASKAVARQLSRHGLSVVVPPESFLVDKGSHLLPGEIERARLWGEQLTTVVDHTRTGGS